MRMNQQLPAFILFFSEWIFGQVEKSNISCSRLPSCASSDPWGLHGKTNCRRTLLPSRRIRRSDKDYHGLEEYSSCHVLPGPLRSSNRSWISGHLGGQWQVHEFDVQSLATLTARPRTGECHGGPITIRSNCKMHIFKFMTTIRSFRLRTPRKSDSGNRYSKVRVCTFGKKR